MKVDSAKAGAEKMGMACSRFFPSIQACRSKDRWKRKRSTFNNPAIIIEALITIKHSKIITYSSLLITGHINSKCSEVWMKVHGYYIIQSR